MAVCQGFRWTGEGRGEGADRLKEETRMKPAATSVATLHFLKPRELLNAKTGSFFFNIN